MQPESDAGRWRGRMLHAVPLAARGERLPQPPATTRSGGRELAPAFRAVTRQVPTGRLAARRLGGLSSLPGPASTRAARPEPGR